MKRDTFWELVEGADTMAASRQSKTRQMPYTYGRAALSLVCAEHWRDFAALEYSGYICPEYGGRNNDHRSAGGSQKQSIQTRR